MGSSKIRPVFSIVIHTPRHFKRIAISLDSQRAKDHKKKSHRGSPSNAAIEEGNMPLV
jgi:hypothetical protein